MDKIFEPIVICLIVLSIFSKEKISNITKWYLNFELVWNTLKSTSG